MRKRQARRILCTMNETIYREPERIQGKGTRELRPAGPNGWAIAAIVIFVGAALWIAWQILHSNAPPPAPSITGSSSRSLAISTDGKLLAVGGLDGTLRVFSTSDGRMLASDLLPGAVMAVSFGPGDAILALAQNDSSLHIFSRDLTVHNEREVQPHPHDVAWSETLDGAVVISGGPDEVHPRLELFPAHPMGIALSTVKLFDLRAWSQPRSVAVSGDGTRVAIALSTADRNNILFYDPKARHIAAVFGVDGVPQGMLFSQSQEQRLWVTSPSAEVLTEIAPHLLKATAYPKAASTSPPVMIAVNEAARRAYTSGSLTFPEVDLDQNKIVRTLELPFRSASIALSPDGKTAYLSSDDQNRIAVVDVQNMKYLRDITWKPPQK
jgi:WD40 repeat protein